MTSFGAIVVLGEMEAALQSRVAVRALTGAILAFFALHVIAVFALRIGLGYDTAFGFVAMFDMDGEGNAPSWFSSALLFMAAAACAFAGQLSQRTEPRLGPYWVALALVFLFLSADEAIRLHEKLMAPIAGRGAFFYGWVLVYGPAVALFGLVMLRFLALLPRRTAVAFVFSGCVYLAGALGMEFVGGSIAYAKLNDTIDHVSGKQLDVLGGDPLYQASVAIEELLEMTGMAFFVVSALRYIEGERAAARR